MDRALWLLLRLRAKGWTRRWSRNLRTLKGTLLALVGVLVFVPSLLAAFFVPRIQIVGQLALIQRFGPLGLLGYCVLNVVLSSGERAVYYSPAEVNYLFCGPFRPRQLLLYKVVGNLVPALFAAAFATLFLQHHAAFAAAAFVGLFLAFELLFLFSVAVSLFAGLVGALAFDRQRKFLLLVVLVVLVVALLPLGHGFAVGAPDVLGRLEQSPVVRIVVTPFRPFVMTFTAQRVWPDLVVQAAISTAIDVALLGIVLGLNFEFLELSATASARRYALLQRARTGAHSADVRSARVRLPMLPWLGGAGPNLWRQLTTAARSFTRTIVVLTLFASPAMMFVLLPANDPQGREAVLYPALSFLASLTVIAPTLLGYDFRPDLVRMEELKTLPIRPSFLAIGQLATPVLIISMGQWFGLAVIGLLQPIPPVLIWAALFLVPPLNFLLVAIENLFFLWFPSRFVPGTSADFQMIGRQLLLMTGRLACGLFAAGLAAGMGVLAFFVMGESWAAAIAAGWFGLAVTGLGLVPLVAQAFRQFDVARDRLE